MEKYNILQKGGNQFSNSLLSITAIALAWLALNRMTLNWYLITLQQASLVSLCILGVGLVLLVVQGLRYWQNSYVEQNFELHATPIILLFSCGIGSIAAHWFLDIDQIPGLLFIIGTYAILGLFIKPKQWQQGLPVGIAIALVLPFCVQFQVGIGYTMRSLTAHFVETILHIGEIKAISSEDLIILENSISRVDLPCSGLKSLWTGTIFLVVATAVENRVINNRWLGICLINWVLLFLANANRVLILVLLQGVLEQPLWAKMLHTTIGGFAFAIVCLITLLLLRWLVPKQSSIPLVATATETNSPKVKYKLAYSIILGCLISLIMIPTAPVKTLSPETLELEFPSTVIAQPLPLGNFEEKFFAKYPEAKAQKHRFEYKNITGSILLVSSYTWQAQHAPENCFINRFYIDEMKRYQLIPGVTGRWLSLDHGSQSAIYWLQSSQGTTDDFLIRFWQGMTHHQPMWIMTSILFDSSQTPEDLSVQKLIAELHNTIESTLLKT